MANLDFVDAHSHVLMEEWYESLRNDFPQYITRIERKPGTEAVNIYTGGKLTSTNRAPLSLADIPRRLKLLDRLKIDKQVISPVPSQFFYDVPWEAAIALSKAQNDGVSSVVRDNPDRFAGVGSVPLQDPKGAATELDRVVNQLRLSGVEIATNVNGMNLDDESLWPFYEKAQELNVPIIVHPINVAGRDRLQKYYLQNLIGNPLDSSIAIASIICGGVLMAFPRLNFLFLHGGGFTPYQIGRLDHGFEVRPETRKIIHKRPSSYLRKTYIDTVLHYPPAIEYLIRTHGPNRVVFGTDFPFDMAPKDPVEELNHVKMQADERSRVSSTNAKRLFGLR